MRSAFPLCGARGIGRVHTAGLERGGIATVEGDGEAKVVPGGWVHQGGREAEIEADVEKNGAERAVAILLDEFGEHFLLGPG